MNNETYRNVLSFLFSLPSFIRGREKRESTVDSFRKSSLYVAKLLFRSHLLINNNGVRKAKTLFWFNGKLKLNILGFFGLSIGIFYEKYFAFVEESK